jgi:predicted transcriptional regulator
MYAVYISRRSMHRTQIYLSSEERQGLQALARQVGRSQSDLIREAIDGFLERHRPSERLSRLRRARGLWRDREDIPSLAVLRGELDRVLPAEGSSGLRP